MKKAIMLLSMIAVNATNQTSLVMSVNLLRGVSLGLQKQISPQTEILIDVGQSDIGNSIRVAMPINVGEQQGLHFEPSVTSLIWNETIREGIQKIKDSTDQQEVVSGQAIYVGVDVGAYYKFDNGSRFIVQTGMSSVLGISYRANLSGQDQDE